MEVNDASGKPTRQLTEDQYREWVRQTISGDIWRKFLGALSLFGLTTIFGVWSYTSNVTNTTIADKIQAQTAGQTTTINKMVGDRINDEIVYQVKHNKLVEYAAKQTVTQLTEQKLIDSELRKLIVAQSQLILRDQDASVSSLRELALQQVLLFGEPAQKAEAINWVLQNPSQTGGAFQLALRAYRLPTDGRDQSEVLQNVLKRALNAQSEFTEESWTAFRTLLGRRAHIRIACQWIRANSAEINVSDNGWLRTVVKIVAEVGSLTAAEEFVEWISSGGADLAELGLYGLGELRLADSNDANQTRLRHGLVRKASAAASRADREREGLSEFLSRSFLAIQLRDYDSLERYARSDLASPRIKDLLRNLGRKNRNSWVLAQREIKAAEHLRTYGQYEHEGLGAAAHQSLASLLDVSPKSEDWKALILPAIAEAKESWTQSGPARLLVNAWVHRLQIGDAPDTSIDVATTLFIDAHAKGDVQLLTSTNFASYRLLVTRASKDVINLFLERAPGMIGVALREGERDARDLVDNNEAMILSDVLTRTLREQLLTEERLRKLRTGLQNAVGQNRQAVWFTAAAQTAGMKDVLVTRDAAARQSNFRRVVSALVDASTSAQASNHGSLPRNEAAALLFIVTNRAFLDIPDIQVAAESANLHLLANEADRFKGEPQALGLAKVIASEASEVFRWVGNLKELPIQRIDSEPIPLTQNVTWLSFERQADRLAQVSVNQPGEMNAIVIGSDERVLEPQIIRAAGSNSPALIRIPDVVSAGTMFLRLRLQALSHSTFAALQHEEFYQAAKVERPKSGSNLPEIRLGASVTIQTTGHDEVWFRLDAKVGTTYVLSTLKLQAATSRDSIDTVIEVWNPDENRKLYEDDDSGEGYASRLSFRANRDASYYVLVRNIESSSGTFAFQVTER
jgi:hypothetical protein